MLVPGSYVLRKSFFIFFLRNILLVCKHLSCKYSPVSSEDNFYVYPQHVVSRDKSAEIRIINTLPHNSFF